MRTYEFVLVLRPIAEPERKKVLETIKSWLKDVKVLSENELGSKALKYKIKRELTGFYYNFQLGAEALPADFERRLLTNESVLRYLIIRRK
jgi:ribosomal protein S6